jgi:hypothetical protein
LYPEAAKWCQTEIQSAIIKARGPEESKRGLMAYYRDADSVNEKVRSLFIDTTIHGGKLLAVASLDLTGPLTPEELDTLRRYMTGQYSDGWGENFGQRDIRMDKGVINAHLWKHGVEFYIDTQEQLSGRLGINLPPDTLSQPPAPGLEELVRRLSERIEGNFAVYKRDMLDLSKEELFYAADEILPVINAYTYSKLEHAYTKSQVEFLLKFENPLEVISDRWAAGMGVTDTAIALFADKEQMLKNSGYKLMPDEPGTTPAAAEPQRAAADACEKPSVLAQIKQHAAEQRERPAAPKDAPGRKKTEPEL